MHDVHFSFELGQKPHDRHDVTKVIVETYRTNRNLGNFFFFTIYFLQDFAFFNFTITISNVDLTFLFRFCISFLYKKNTVIF